MSHLEPQRLKNLVYNPLASDKKQIRILHLSPAEGGDETQCELVSVSLVDQHLPQYETISYVWGDSTIRSNIKLDNTLFDVPASSAAALRSLRLERKARTLWIDAICINQEDIEERGQQVALMGDIYRKSTGNLVYLGEQGHAERSIRHLDFLVHKIETRKNELSQKDQDTLESGGCPAVWRNSDLISNHDMVQMQDLYKHPYFSRLWVVQEATLAPHNTCLWKGLEFMLPDVLRIARLWLGVCRTEKLDADETNGFLPAIYMWQHINPRRKVLSASILRWRLLFTTSRRLQVTDLRDHVFALNELFRSYAGLDHLPISMMPDYKAGLFTVFCNATLEFLTTDCDWIWLYHHRKREEEARPPLIPTWAVDWRWVNAEAIIIEDASAGMVNREDPHGHLRLEVIGPQRALIKIEGHFVGTIVERRKHVADEDMTDVRSLGSCVQAVRDMVASFSQNRGASCYDVDVTVLSLVKRGGRDRTFESWQQAMCGYLELLDQVTPVASQSTLSVQPLSELGNLFYISAKMHLRNRCIFRTDRSSFGSGPRFTNVGDRIFIPIGGMFPHVLRPFGDGTYLYLGTTYIHGYMGGEVFRSGLSTEWITLR